jgi:hypothetical protein
MQRPAIAVVDPKNSTGAFPNLPYQAYSTIASISKDILISPAEGYSLRPAEYCGCDFGLYSRRFRRGGGRYLRGGGGCLRGHFGAYRYSRWE